VIGSVKAVVTNRNGSEGPSHWRRFISSLNPKEDKEKQSADDSRCGNELPICCPRHGKQVKLNVTKLSDFPVEKEKKKIMKHFPRSLKVFEIGQTLPDVLPNFSPKHF